MKRLLIAATMVGLACAASAAWQKGQGLANDRTTGANDRDVMFVTRGAGDGYGWRQYSLPIGLTILPWSVPNFESSVYGLRSNLGWGGYADTYGLDAGVFSNRRHFRGISANLFGNYAADESIGLETGAVNIAGIMRGVQIGFVNFVDCLYGVQIGCLNFNRAGIAFPVINVGW